MVKNLLALKQQDNKGSSDNLGVLERVNRDV